MVRRGVYGTYSSLDDIFASGTVDQKKGFVAIYVKTIEADPNAKSVKISRFPALFSQIIAGGRLRQG